MTEQTIDDTVTRAGNGSLPSIRRYFEDMEQAGKRAEFIEHVDRILAVSRKYLTIYYAGRTSGFADFAQEVVRVKSMPFAELSDVELDLLSAVGLFGMARVRLEQVGLTVNMENALQYLRTTIDNYNQHLAEKGEAGIEISEGQPWWVIAPELPEMRRRIDKHFYRMAQIDGSNWNRSELLLDRESIDPAPVPQTLKDLLLADLPDLPALGEGNLFDYLREQTRALISRENSPIRLLKAVMRAASEDPITDSDYSTLLFPRGTKLLKPWTSSPDDFAAFVVFRTGFEPPKQEGVGDFEMIQKAMLAHHAAKKARNATAYLVKYGPDAKPSLSDDLGELGVYYNESSHHKGHMICGVRAAMRFLMGIEVQNQSGHFRVEGLTDFRLTRVSNAEEDRYIPAQFPMFYNYGRWIRTIVEASFDADFVFPRSLAAA